MGPKESNQTKKLTYLLNMVALISNNHILRQSVIKIKEDISMIYLFKINNTAKLYAFSLCFKSIQKLHAKYVKSMFGKLQHTPFLGTY